MLDLAFKFLAAELNSYLRARTDSDFGEAEICRLVDDAGKWAVKEDHLGVSLIGIEEDRILKSQLPEHAYIDGRHVILEPEIKINLHVIIAAHFKVYEEALKYISHVMTFFQSHPTFTQEQYPALDSRIRRLIPELQTLSYEQLNQVWAFIGGKQIPSAVYKIRMVVLQDVEQMAVRPPVTQVTTVMHDR